MDLNRGRFLKNGQCGYILKPSVMREGKTWLLLMMPVVVTFQHQINHCKIATDRKYVPRLYWLKICTQVVLIENMYPGCTDWKYVPRLYSNLISTEVIRLSVTDCSLPYVKLKIWEACYWLNNGIVMIINHI